MNHQIFNKELLARVLVGESSDSFKRIAFEYSLGKNLTEIAKQYEVSRERIRKILAKCVDIEYRKLQ